MSPSSKTSIESAFQACQPAQVSQVKELTPEIIAAYERGLTSAGANVLIGWLLQAAIDSPQIADTLARFHASCERGLAAPLLTECFISLRSAPRLLSAVKYAA